MYFIHLQAYSTNDVEVVEPGPSSKINSESSGKRNEKIRRSSIFTPVKRTGTEGGGPRVSQGRPMPDLSNSFGLDDFCYRASHYSTYNL